jgi:hypothetical protein
MSTIPGITATGVYGYTAPTTDPTSAPSVQAAAAQLAVIETLTSLGSSSSSPLTYNAAGLLSTLQQATSNTSNTTPAQAGPECSSPGRIRHHPNDGFVDIRHIVQLIEYGYHLAVQLAGNGRHQQLVWQFLAEWNDIDDRRYQCAAGCAECSSQRPIRHHSGPQFIDLRLVDQFIFFRLVTLPVSS